MTFDAATGAVVGESDTGDIGFGPCNAHTYEWGTTSAACANNVPCTVCGNTTYAPLCP